ncbi:triokinase/FMN cyclase [Aspergillus lentulus]|uniref:Triokinase/FMN cyclase n=1 Tax=Aspergillus lentulus TaxID=293939 RepID=A0AAN4TC40_ASPLE|nr:triokinase/FMN cyclase [Aspergillus lentulus]
MIVKNYTGDKLNFGLAAQKAKAQGLGIEIVFVGVLFVQKIAGATANTGVDLAAVASIARKVACQMGTAAASLDRCSLPRHGALESLPQDEIDFGMGIHNEPGVRREKLCTLAVTVNTILDIVLKPRAGTWTPTTGQPVAVIVNNLGGLSVLELGVIAEEVLRLLDARDIEVARSMSRTFVSSLDGPGFSVTLLGLDDELMPLLDAPTAAPAWPTTMPLGWKGELESKNK